MTVKKLCKEFDIKGCKQEFRLLKDKYLSIKSADERLKIKTAENNAKELKKQNAKPNQNTDDDDDESADELDCSTDVDENTPQLIKFAKISNCNKPSVTDPYIKEN